MDAAEVTTAAKSAFTVRNLSPVIGAEIIGIDTANPPDAATMAAIRKVWLERLVIVFRGQSIDEEQQVRFAELFGPLHRSKTTGKAIMYVSNVVENGKLIGSHPDGEMHFHTDQAHQEQPCSATMLYAVDTPHVGGNTLFANAYYAYDTLPADLRARIDGRRAINAYDHSAGEFRGTFTREGIPRASHPMVRTHPETGRKALYVNRLMTAQVEGLDKAESEDLLMALFEHQERPEYVYAHAWRPGDMVIWDNRCTLHARTDFDASERRLLRRVTMLGEKPV
jgi:taurine dioxygenase